MSLESVRAFLASKAPDVAIIPLESGSTTSTVSAFLNVQPAQVAKALMLKVGERNLLLMACGDSRLDNRKVKEVFGGKARMVAPEEAAILTGHPVGGVCPFALATPLPVYCDIRLKTFDIVVPGGGSTHSAVPIDPTRMATLAGAEWVDVCEEPR